MTASAPRTRYARSGDVHIAYQVVGAGPFDLVMVPGWLSHVEFAWEEPAMARFFRRLASFSRVILFDKRGTGLSDPVPLTQLPTLEERMDDVRAVMDAAGAGRAALLGVSEGGPMACLFAATYPRRTTALVLYGAYARVAWAPDYPQGTPPERFERLLRLVDEAWGTGAVLEHWAPDSSGDARLRQWWAREVMGDKVGGIAVHLGARVAALAGAGEVLVSRTVKDLVAGSGIRFVDRGVQVLKGIPGEWPLFAVAGE